MLQDDDGAKVCVDEAEYFFTGQGQFANGVLANKGIPENSEPKKINGGFKNMNWLFFVANFTFRLMKNIKLQNPQNDNTIMILLIGLVKTSSMTSMVSIMNLQPLNGKPVPVNLFGCEL